MRRFSFTHMFLLIQLYKHNTNMYDLHASAIILYYYDYSSNYSFTHGDYNMTVWSIKFWIFIRKDPPSMFISIPEPLFQYLS